MSNLETSQGKIEKILSRRIEDNHVFPSAEKAIEMLMGGQLTIYFGIDPTGPNIHIGHTVPLLFLKDLFGLGHKIIILIGDFTAMIGDPTDKEATRTALLEGQVKENLATYTDQIEKILPRGSYGLKYNSRWLKDLNLKDVIGLASRATVQQMLTRDMFQERIKNEKPIYIHEFLYPLMQGYDSVAMKIDGEVGGNDQIFNMLVGRELVKEYLGKEKLVFATRLLVNTATGKKLSKTEGGFITLNDEPSEIRRKILAIDDKMIKPFFELCTEADIDSIDFDKSPRELKEELANELVLMYHGMESIKKAKEPQEIEFKKEFLAEELYATGVTTSISAAKRLIDQGGVRVNGDVAQEWNQRLKPGDTIRVGQGKFFKIKNTP